MSEPENNDLLLDSDLKNHREQDQSSVLSVGSVVDFPDEELVLQTKSKHLENKEELDIKNKNILKKRAEALAVALVEKKDEEHIDVVEFSLATETYAIESSWVREVHPLKELTPVPCTPDFVLGIINVHGRIVSVIDLKKFFGLPEKGLTSLNKVVIISNSKMEFGILADAVLGAISILKTSIQPALLSLSGIKADYLMGVTPELVVLDAGKILSDNNIVVHEEV